MSNNKIQNLLEELKRRRVFRVATLYVVAMWPVIQIADILSPALNLPDDVMQTLLLVFIAGFPFAMAFAWLFNLTPKGLVKVDDIKEGVETDSAGRLVGKNVELIIVCSLLLIAILLFIFQGAPIGTGTSHNPPGKLNSAVENNKLDSIAVLPFVPISEKMEDEFFADGLSEELLNVLAKIKTLHVAARTSSFAYKGVNRNIQEVGRELGVDAILGGSVRRNDIDNTIRVTANLTDVKTGANLWSETYDRQFKDIFKIQDEITASVVSELKITLLQAEQDTLLAHETANPEAMVAHSMGRAELAKRTGVAVEQAAKYFNKAIEIDPGYATAYASLAEAFVLMIEYANKPLDEQTAKAQDAVNKALKIDNKLGLAWAAQGLIHLFDKEKKSDAQMALEKAMELNPSYAMAYMWYGNTLDDFEKKKEYQLKAFQLDPKSPVAGFNVASNYISEGRNTEAMEVFSQIVEADPYYPGAYSLVGQINQKSGRIDQAIIQYKKAVELGAESWVSVAIAELYLDLADHENARQWIAKAKQGAMEKQRKRIEWLEITALLVEGKKDDIIVALQNFNHGDRESLYDYYHAVTTNYWLRKYPEVIELFEQAEILRQKLKLDVIPDGSLEAHVYATYAYQQLEYLDKSNELISLVHNKLDELSTGTEQKSAELWYLKSLIHAIEDEGQLSLMNLQRSIDEGWTKPWRVKEEPILFNLNEDTNFRAMIAGLEARINLMREQLAFEESFAS